MLTLEDLPEKKMGSMRIVVRCLAPFTALALTGCLSLPADSLVVKTMDGKVHGKLINNGKVRAFQGVPYAAPPVEGLRWKAPQPVAAWKGTLDATAYGHHCAQNHVFDDMIFQDIASPADAGSEDCLSLNVYVAASKSANAKLPVMVWIHGGGYFSGASSEPRHNGDFLPLKGIVLVTINYRLGVFGFLALPELASESRGFSGNYGLMDMVAALEWVKKNIGDFGGDPHSVTIFGESAGSFAVSTLMAAPSAQGLFHRAIGESGGALNLGALPVDGIAIVGPQDAAWAKEAGANTLAELRAMRTDKILAAAAKKDAPHFGPVVDGKFLSRPILGIYEGGKQAAVPLLAGFNRDERFFLSSDMTADKWTSMAVQRYADRADTFLKLYPGSTDAEAVRSAADLSGDQFIGYGTWKWMEIDRKTGNQTIYRYQLDLAAPPSKFHPGSYAFHSDDIEYVFGTLDTRPGAVWRPEDYKLSDQIMSYWTNFAKTGDPNGVDGKGDILPMWPQYGEGDPVLHLDSPITSRPDEKRGRYEWLESDK
jgi:para-nitrobenzyl esterase